MSRDTVRLKTLDGTWETLGVDRLEGVMPEGIQASVNLQGPATWGARLKRRNLYGFDLSAFTDLEYERDGMKVFSGYIQEAPGQVAPGDSSLAPAARGWQYHADDDLADLTFVHNRMQDWRDVRTYPSANFALYTQKGDVKVGSGHIAIGWPAGTTVNPGDAVGVVLDFGPDQVHAGIGLSYLVAGALDANVSVYVRASDAIDWVGATNEDLSVAAMTVHASFGVNLAVPAGKRYMHIFLYRSGAGATIALDETVCITQVSTYSSGAYMSGLASIVTTDKVITRLLASGTLPLLSTDASRVVAGTWSPPFFDTGGPQAPRKILDRIFAYEDQSWFVDVERRLGSLSRPTVPTVRADRSVTFRDASANAGADIYNRAWGVAEDQFGEPVSVRRSTGEVVSSGPAVTSAVQHLDPSFEANPLVHWGVYIGNISLTSDATQFQTGVRSAAIAPNAGASGTGQVQSITTGNNLSLKAGTTYRFTLAIRRTASWTSGNYTVRLNRQNPTTLAYTTPLVVDGAYAYSVLPAGVWTRHQIVYTPKEDMIASVGFSGTFSTGGIGVVACNLDDVLVEEMAPTILDKRGRRRTALFQTRAALDAASMQRILDLWLAIHMKAQFKGSVVVTPGSVTDYLSGRAVPPAEMLLRYGQLMHFGWLRDPDTGAMGRDGLIVGVSYDAEKDEATVELDNSRGSFDALLERVAAVQSYIFGN